MSRPYFPGDPSIGAAEESIAVQRLMADIDLSPPTEGFSDGHIDEDHDRRWLNAKHDRDSKMQPLTESEGLWRIELAILRVARALESK